MAATASLSQLDRHHIASKALNVLIAEEVLHPSKREKGYRRLRAILAKNAFRSADELVEAIRKNLKAQKDLEQIAS
jgi:3-hydroxyacyl-CoA dehydrogenase